MKAHQADKEPPAVDEGGDAFARLLGRQPSNSERARLNHVRDELGLRGNDALWLVLTALQYHQCLYEAIPRKIEIAALAACARVTSEIRSAARTPASRGFGWFALALAAVSGALVSAILTGLGLAALIFKV